jgi:hypothetical protein
MRLCEQGLCELRGIGRCPTCSGCGSPPNKVDDNCEECHCCEREIGYVRGERKRKIEVGLAIKEGTKIIIIKQKEQEE